MLVNGRGVMYLSSAHRDGQEKGVRSNLPTVNISLN